MTVFQILQENLYTIFGMIPVIIQGKYRVIMRLQTQMLSRLYSEGLFGSCQRLLVKCKVFLFLKNTSLTLAH